MIRTVSYLSFFVFVHIHYIVYEAYFFYNFYIDVCIRILFKMRKLNYIICVNYTFVIFNIYIHTRTIHFTLFGTYTYNDYVVRNFFFQSFNPKSGISATTIPFLTLFNLDQFPNLCSRPIAATKYFPEGENDKELIKPATAILPTSLIHL